MTVTHNPFDKAARFAAKMDPVGFLAWTLGVTASSFSFHGWLDTREVPFPGADERTGDTVARVANLTAGGVPWAVAVEFQIEPDARMFGRLLNYLSGIWLAKKPDGERGSRFALGAVVVNLTGRGDAARSFDWPESGMTTTLTPREWNLATERAAPLLGAIESGERSRSLLPWVPLMTGADAEVIVEWWKRLADAEPDFRRRSELGSLAKVFAEAAARKQLWIDSLRRWNVRESTVVNEWIDEGRQEGLVKGRQEGQAIGQRTGQLEFLEAVLTSKFGPLPEVSLSRLRALSDEHLKSIPGRLLAAQTLADLDL